METINLILRYGFGIAVVLEGGWIAWALVKLARDKAHLEGAPAAAEDEQCVMS